jgi:hypothetical protein
VRRLYHAHRDRDVDSGRRKLFPSSGAAIETKSVGGRARERESERARERESERARERESERDDEEVVAEGRGGEGRGDKFEHLLFLTLVATALHYREKTREIRPRLDNEAAPFITIISYRAGARKITHARALDAFSCVHA